MMARVNLYAGAYSALKASYRRAKAQGDTEAMGEIQESLDSIERHVVMGQGVKVGHWLYEVCKATKENIADGLTTLDG